MSFPGPPLNLWTLLSSQSLLLSLQILSLLLYNIVATKYMWLIKIIRNSSPSQWPHFKGLNIYIQALGEKYVYIFIYIISWFTWWNSTWNCFCSKFKNHCSLYSYYIFCSDPWRTEFTSDCLFHLYGPRGCHSRHLRDFRLVERMRKTLETMAKCSSIPETLQYNYWNLFAIRSLASQGLDDFPNILITVIVSKNVFYGILCSINYFLFFLTILCILIYSLIYLFWSVCTS